MDRHGEKWITLSILEIEESASKDFTVRKALAWSACKRIMRIWRSYLPRKMKIWLFLYLEESVFLSGAKTWNLMKSLTKQLHGCYTRTLRMAWNASWKSHEANKLWGELSKVQQKRIRNVCHSIQFISIQSIYFWKKLKCTKITN